MFFVSKRGMRQLGNETETTRRWTAETETGTETAEKDENNVEKNILQNVKHIKRKQMKNIKNKVKQPNKSRLSLAPQTKRN